MPIGYQRNFFGPDDPVAADGWEAFHIWRKKKRNADLMEQIERYALRMRKHRTKYSVYAIVEVARWHMIVRQPKRGDFLIDNNMRPYIVRFLRDKHPKLLWYFFETRASYADGGG